MFTGIVEKTVKVIGAADGPGFRRLTLPDEWNDVKLGESIAINGVCLTVAEMLDNSLGFDVIQETLDKTNLGLLNNNDLVNVERSLRAGDRIDGHFVLGHVDGTGVLTDLISDRSGERLRIEAPAAIAKFLAPKGSICVDGVSLTIASLRAGVFEVALIPTTLRFTTLGTIAPGWPVNLESDILSKTIVQYLEQRGIGTA